MAPTGGPSAAASPAAPDPTPKAAEFTKPAVSSDPVKLGQPALQAAQTTDPAYQIGAEDLLGIGVWGDPRLSGNFVVRPDGRISMALIGEIVVAGQTPTQLESTIAEMLKAKDILRKPQVTVQVNQINSKKYFIQGEVLKPGPNPLVVPTTVMEALVNAGGFKDFANTKKIEILRGAARYKFNYKEVVRGKRLEQNIALKPGDIIIVP